MNKPVAFLAAFAAGFLLAPTPAGDALAVPTAEASVAYELSLSDLVRASSLVAVVSPIESRSLWETDEGGRGQRIATYTRVRVARVLDGAAGPDDVWVRTLGGRVGSVGQVVDGEASLSPGHDALLFLAKREDATLAVVGMAQGQFDVAAAAGRSPTVAPSRAPGLLIAKSTAGAVAGSARSALAGRTLDEVAALVKTARGSHAK